MARSKIAIIGTGLIGTSIGLNLMSRKDRSYEVVGIDRDRTHTRTAKKLEAIDREVGSLEEAVTDAGLVILAVPVQASHDLMESMGPYLRPGAVVTDTCSTKSEIMRWAKDLLPEGVHFVGTHPMAGKESSGPRAAAMDLFQGATWAVMPSPAADEGAVNVILGLIESLGAHPLHIDPAEHDQYAAAVSHVPILLSVALFRLVRDSAGWEDAALLSGPAFKDLTRLASGDPVMSTDIMGTNREAVLHWLRRYRESLEAMEKMLADDQDELAKLFASTYVDREAFLTNPRVERQQGGIPLPSSQDAMGQMLVGKYYERLKELTSGDSAAKMAKIDREELRRKLERPGKNGDR
jgi:prephenate dehydrogenase